MARAAEIDRRTAETDIRLTLALDGDGHGERDTGVGFFDHMLDLLARHGRFDLTVQAPRRPADRRAPHRRGRRDLPRPGAGPGARRPLRASPLRAGDGPDGREPRVVRRRHLRARAAAPSRRRCRPARSANFDHELTEEFFRAFAANAKLTLHLTVEAGHQRPPRDRGRVQGLRARAARRGGHGPDRERRAQHQGDADVTTVAVVDYGMGNRRSVEKALEHVGARAVDHARPARAGSRPTRWSSPAWARSRTACAICRARPGRADPAAAAAGTPVLGICLGMQLLFERSAEHGLTDGLGLLGGRGEPARRRRAADPAHRLERRALRAAVAAHRRAARRELRLLPRAFAGGPARAIRPTSSPPPSTGALCDGRRARQRVRGPVSPREVLARRAARC